MKEQWRRGRAILSGSSMSQLFSQEVRYPVGRTIRYKIAPLTFVEFLLALEKNFLYEQVMTWKPEQELSLFAHQELLTYADLYLKVGGLPEVVSTFINGRDYRRLRKKIILEQEEDFYRKAGLLQKYLFMDAFKGVANNLGYPSKFTHIADKKEEAKRILNLLESWHLVLTIEQHNLASTSYLHPKRYLYDLGVAQDMRNLPFPELSILNTANSNLRTQLGGILENFVLLNFGNHQLWKQNISSWRASTQDRLEVDFVWRFNDLVIPIECKSAVKISGKHFASLSNFLATMQLNFAVLISAAPYQLHKINGKTFVNLPLYLCTPQNLSQIVH
jgi:predicted AAA+ superfamily ATPase